MEDVNVKMTFSHNEMTLYMEVADKLFNINVRIIVIFTSLSVILF
jgi:hypothetical protein